MIERFAAEIARWIDKHGGRVPARVRVPEMVMDQLSKDAAQHNPDFKKLERIRGVLVVVDPKLTVGQYDES